MTLSNLFDLLHCTLKFFHRVPHSEYHKSNRACCIPIVEARFFLADQDPIANFISDLLSYYPLSLQ